MESETYYNKIKCHAHMTKVGMNANPQNHLCETIQNNHIILLKKRCKLIVK